MKQTVLVFALLFSSVLLSFAQNDNSNKLEVGVGYAYQMGRTDDGVNFKHNQSFPTYFEWRRMAGKHLDYGARAVIRFGLAEMDHYNGVVIYGGLFAVSDFNFLPGRAVNPYIGISAGPGIGSVNVGMSYVDFLLSVSPRIGLEIVNHLRISAGFNLSIDTHADFDPLYLPAYITLGWTF